MFGTFQWNNDNSYKINSSSVYTKPLTIKCYKYMSRKQASKKLRTRLVIPIIVASVVNIVNMIGTLHIPGSGETFLFHSYIQHDQIDTNLVISYLLATYFKMYLFVHPYLVSFFLVLSSLHCLSFICEMFFITSQYNII